MTNSAVGLVVDGFFTVEHLVTDHRCAKLIKALPLISSSGSRTLLTEPRFRVLAQEIRNHHSLINLLKDLVAIQCTLFHKTEGRNWSVRLHRDTVIPVRGDGPWKSAGIKEAMHTAKPPREFLDSCVAVRLHLDGAVDEDISVVPGSHLDASLHSRAEAVPIPVPKGGALVMRPTLAHASSRLTTSTSRRVLHYLFASPVLPEQYDWYYAV